MPLSRHQADGQPLQIFKPLLSVCQLSFCSVFHTVSTRQTFLASFWLIKHVELVGERDHSDWLYRKASFALFTGWIYTVHVSVFTFFFNHCHLNGALLDAHLLLSQHWDFYPDFYLTVKAALHYKSKGLGWHLGQGHKLLPPVSIDSNFSYLMYAQNVWVGYWL